MSPGEDATSTPYGEAFFAEQSAGSRQSAQVVVSLLSTVLRPRSVLDVGSGVGTWIAEWQAAGLSDVMAVDGAYVEADALQIPAENFLAADLTRPLHLDRRFDLVQCLEVAEHLEEVHAGTLVSSLTRHGEVIVFSAAIPGQGGTHHVNEQWPSYWHDKFVEQDYALFDVIRPEIWSDTRVDWWYRQNLLIFARGRSVTRRLRRQPKRGGILDVVHPRMVGRSEPRPRPD